jgi:hypothetical protein
MKNQLPHPAAHWQLGQRVRLAHDPRTYEVTAGEYQRTNTGGLWGFRIKNVETGVERTRVPQVGDRILEDAS